MSLQADLAGSGPAQESPAGRAEDAASPAVPATTAPVNGAAVAAMGLTLSAALLMDPAWTHASPGQARPCLAGGAALLLSALVLIVIIPGRVVVAVSRRYAE